MFLLQDSSNNIWAVSVNDSGQLTSNPSTGVASTVILAETNGALWKVSITTGGLLVTTSVASGQATKVVLQAPGGSLWDLTVVGGLLQTALHQVAAVPGYHAVDSNGILWAITVNTDGSLSTQFTGGTASPTVVIADTTLLGTNWQLGVATDGSIQVTLTPGPVSTALVLLDQTGSAWTVGVDSGTVFTTALGIIVPPPPPPGPCVVPMPPNVLESLFGTGALLIHTPTGFPVTVRADFSCFVCNLNAFVPPEQTNMLLILDE